jgi:hypothetical protein
LTLSISAENAQIPPKGRTILDPQQQIQEKLSVISFLNSRAFFRPQNTRRELAANLGKEMRHGAVSFF